MTEVVARAFTWLNARVQVQGAMPTRVEYHTWYLLATLDSADRWQQVVRVDINASTGAWVSLPDPVDVGLVLTEPAHPSAESPGEDGDQAGYASTRLPAVRAALQEVHRESRAFLERQESRLARDRKRLQDYYRALLWGDRKRTKKQSAENDPAKREAKQKAVQLELHRKLAELDERYACRVELAPLGVVRTQCPALGVRCRVQRRDAVSYVTLYWNPLSKDLEPLACSRCGVSTFSLAFSDGQVAELCGSCRR
jgi:hypothetical protein